MFGPFDAFGTIQNLATVSAPVNVSILIQGRGARGILTLSFTREEGGPMLKPGDKAPEFTGRDHTGKTITLSELKGKKVVLWFYPKADTPG